MAESSAIAKVVESVRSWRDTTAELLPRVAAAAATDGKALKAANDAPSADKAKSLRKAAEKALGRSDQILELVEELVGLMGKFGSTSSSGAEKEACVVVPVFSLGPSRACVCCFAPLPS